VMRALTLDGAPVGGKDEARVLALRRALMEEFLTETE